MTLNEAGVFVKVVEAGSFSAAARLLGLPTSTVSTRVARLEGRLGVTLLQRTTRRLNLTDAGALYYHHASTGLAHLLDAEAAVTEASGEPKGLLRVTAPADIGDCILGRIVHQMRQHYPKVGVELLLMDRYVDLIAEGVDVAIRIGKQKDSTLIARQVGIARWALFASADYLKSAPKLATPQALSRHRCLQFTPLGKEVWTLSSPRGSVTLPLSGAVMVNDLGVIHAMALAGEGIALLPRHLGTQGHAAGTLVRVLPGWHGKTDPVHLVHPRQRFLSPRLRGFIDLAAQVLGKELEAG